MASKTINTSIPSAEHARIQDQLEAMNLRKGDIDKMLASGQIGELTQRDYMQYFQLSWNALDSMTNRLWESDNKSMAGAPPGPGEYQGYFVDAYDIGKAMEGFDFISPTKLLDANQMGRWVNFSERELQAYQRWLGQDPAQGTAPASSPAGAGASTPYSGGGSSGGSQGGQGGGGSSGKTLSVQGGGSKNLGAPPPPPGMGAPGGYPPPPPMGGGYPGGGGGSMSQDMNFFPQKEYEWFTQNLSGGPGNLNLGADWMSILFPMRGNMGSVMAGATEQLNSLDQFQRQMMTVYQGLDLANPADARKAFAIQQELQMLGGKRTEIVDKMMRFKTYYDENLKVVKEMKDEVLKGVQAIIQNIK